MHPPITENYYSTLHIAEASVCEVPILKVTKWIESNDFQHSGGLLKTKSFDSLATSQMIAYICENDKKKIKAPCTALPDYIEQTSCQQSFSKADDLSSIHSLPLSCADKQNCSVSTKANQMYPYFDENTFTNNNHLESGSHNSLPEYMREAGDQTDSSDDSSTDISHSSLSLDAVSLPGGKYQSKRPQDLQLRNDNFMPYVSDSDCLRMNSDLHPKIKRSSYVSKDTLDDCGDDSGLNTATTTMELGESHFGYYDLLSNKSEADFTSGSCQSSASDLFELDDDDIDIASHNIAIFGKHLTLKSVSDDDAQSSPASHSSLSEHYFDNEVDNVRKVSTVYSSGISSGYVEDNDKCFSSTQAHNGTSYISHYVSSDMCMD